MTASAVLLALGVLAYGLAGARLHEGSGADGGALRSRAWWTGTLLQAAGFGLTLVARRSLPLLIVQAVSVAGLGVTALVQHLAGTRRLHRREVTALVVLLGGLALLSTATVPGPAVAIRGAHVALLAAGTLAGLAAVARPLPSWASGLASGLGFSLGAVGARLVVGDAAHPLWLFWRLPAATWAVGLLTGAGIVLGQLHLTRGLARARAVDVLGPMYLVETLLPAVVGLALLGEAPRGGTAPLAVAGLVATGVAARALLGPGAHPLPSDNLRPS